MASKSSPASVITVDGTPLLRKSLDGIGRYSANYLTNLAQALPNTSLTVLGFFDDPDLSIKLPNVTLKRLPMPRRVYQCTFKYLRPIAVNHWLKNLPDIHLCFNFTSFPYIKNTKNIVFIHDLAYYDIPETVDTKNVSYLNKMVPWSLKQAHAVATISSFTHLRLKKLYGKLIEGKTLITATPGVGSEFLQAHHTQKRLDAVRQKYHLPSDEFLLSVGTDEPRKNLQFLVDTYLSLAPQAQRKHKLVLVGGAGWKNQTVVASPNIIRTGFVDDADLPLLYALAGAFVMPSYYEGFGIPILESMAQGTPIIANSIPPFREISNKLHFFKSKDELLELLKRDYNKNGQLVADAKQFEWSNVVKPLTGYINAACS
jgi:alpha-1,3-rhamnosyl/mannosyltransferase